MAIGKYGFDQKFKGFGLDPNKNLSRASLQKQWWPKGIRWNSLWPSSVRVLAKVM
jgi:hypothetical protein